MEGHKMITDRQMFPVFSGLHVVSTPPAAKLEPKEPKPGPLTVTGNVCADLETALRAIAFLVEFMEGVGADGFRECADTLQEFRRERGL
jgi:hypothetical protein